MNLPKFFIVILMTISYFSLTSPADTLYVGPNQPFRLPSEVVDQVQDGDIVLIDSGTYRDQACTWYADNIVLKGKSRYAHLIAPTEISNGKAIWVTKGSNITIENIEFSKASVPDENGAGIRAEGDGLIIQNCYFHDNENGILGGRGEMVIEYSIFANNGFGDGYSHNLYILDDVTQLTFQYNYSHHAKIGHNLKSRAQENRIFYNRIMDEHDGTASYCIDLPNGGLSYLIGNLLQQGPQTDNSTIVSYGAEGLAHPQNELYVSNNTIVNNRSAGTFIRTINGSDKVILINNLIIGPGTVLAGPGEEITTLRAGDTAVVDANAFDYCLAKESPAIDKGTQPGMINGISLKPLYEYVHPANKRSRTSIDSIDVGCYEYGNPIAINPKPLKPGIGGKWYINILNRRVNLFSQMKSCKFLSLSFYTINGRYIGTYTLNHVSNQSYFTEIHPLPAGIYVMYIETSLGYFNQKRIIIPLG